VDLQLIQRRLTDLFEKLIHPGLQFSHVHLALAEPLVERMKGRGGEQFGHAGHGRFSTGGAGAADMHGMFVQPHLEVLP